MYDVVKIDVESQALRDLNAAISQAFEVTDTYPEYHPHVTIAYVKKGMGRAHIGEDDFAGLDVPIDRLIFSSKMGRQTIIPLAGV
jgi:2'-5' RNA ligase